MNEQDIQQLIHIRDEIHEEIKKIGSHTASLHNATTSLLSQVDVFKSLSQTAQEQMKASINDASLDMAHRVSEALSSNFSSKLEVQIEGILTTLDQSVQYARKTLDFQKGKDPKAHSFMWFRRIILLPHRSKPRYVYAKRHTYALPPDFLKMYALGHEYKMVLSKKSPRETKDGEKAG